MAGNDPPYLNVGTEVSAKYRGAFCEAKVKIIVKKVKCKVLLKESQTSIIVTDESVKGPLKMGALVEVKHPDSGQVLEATITRMTDSSMYTVVFDDGDERTLRRTQLCLKGDKHFIESETLDNLPLSNPEHFGTPVMGSKKSKGRFSTGNDEDTEDTSSDESDIKRATYKGKILELLRKVMLVEVGEKKKLTIPVLVVLPDAHQTELKTKDHVLVKSFKDGKFLSVHKKDLKEFVREIALKNEEKPVKAAMEKALMYYDNQDLPSGWDLEELLGIDEDECSDEEESSDDEQTEEKDRFVAQLYKFMDDRGTPINKAPCLGNKDLNLYRLFKIVQNIGGYNRVTNQLKWRYVYAKMALPQSNQASHQIKNAYKKYLHAFEDFYRKLGCTMGTISRPGRSRNNSGRGMMAFRGQNKEGKKDDDVGKESDKDDKKSSDEDSKSEEKRTEECKESEDVSPVKSPPKRERLTRKDLMKDDKDKKEDVKDKKTEKSEKEEETVKKAVKKEELKKETKKDELKKDTKKEEQKKDNKKDETKKDIKKEEGKKEIKKEEPKKDLKKDETPVIKKGRAIKKEKDESKEKKDDQKKESDDEKDDASDKSDQKKVSRRRSMRKDEIKKEIGEGEEVKNNETPEKEIKPKVKAAVRKEEKKDDKPTKVLTKKEGKTDDDKKAKPESVTKKPKIDENKKSKPEKVDIDNKKTKTELKELDKSKSKVPEETMDVESSTEDVKVSTNRVSKEYPQGTKLKVLYGRGKNQKIYEAKIIEASREGGLQYLVHYAGWNNRYDEWIKPERIVRVLDKPDVKAVKPQPKTPKVTQQPTVRGRARSLTPKGAVPVGTESSRPATVQNTESDIKNQSITESRPVPVSQVQQNNRESRAPTKQSITSSSSLFPSMGIAPHQQPTVNLKPMSASSIESHISSEVKPVTTALSPPSLITASNLSSIDTPQTDNTDNVTPSSTTLPKSKTMTDGSQVASASPNCQGVVENSSTIKTKSPATKPGKPRSTRSNSTDFGVMDGLPPKQRKSKRSTGGQSDATLTGSESDDNDQSDTDTDVNKDQTTTVTDSLVEEISHVDNLNTTMECMNKSLDKVDSDSPSKDSEKSEDSMRDDMPKLSPVSIPLQFTENDNVNSPSPVKDNMKDDKKFDKMAKISLIKVEVNSSSPSKEAEKKTGSEISDIIHRKIEAEVSKDIDNSVNSKSADLKDSELSGDNDNGVSESNVINKTDEDVKSPPKLYNLSNNDKPLLKKEMVPVIDDRFEFKDDSDEDLPLPDLRAEIHLEKERIKLECENEKKKEKSKKPVKEKKEVKETKRMRTLAERKIGPPNLVYVEYGFFEPPNKKQKEDDEKPTKDGDSNTAKSEDSYSSSESQDVRNLESSDVKEENEMEKKKVKKKVKKKKDTSESSVNSESESKKEVKGAKVKGEKPATKAKGNKKNKEAVSTATVPPEFNEEQVVNDSAIVSTDKVSDNELAQSHVTSDSKAVIHSSEPSGDDEQVQISSLAMEATNESSAKVSCSSDSSKLISSDSKVDSNLLMDNTPPTTPEHQIEDSSCSSQEKSHEPIKLPEISHLHEQHYGGESPAGNASPSSNDGSVGSGNVACSESSSNDTPIATTNVKRRRESDEPTPSKKKRKGRHKSSTDKKSNKHQGSDSDEAYNTDHRFSPEPVGSLGKMSGSHSPRPPKFNLNLDEGQYLEGEQRISFLMEKIQEIRKVYMNLKSEVATIDRRRKRARRRERESAHSSSNAEGEFVR